MLKLIERAKLHVNNIAVKYSSQSYSYNQLLTVSENLAQVILANKTDINEARVAMMVNPGFDYIAVQWAIWRAGGVAVPLCLTYPLPSLQYTIEDSESSIVIVSEAYAPLLNAMCEGKKIGLLVVGKEIPESIKNLPDISSERNAMILYTSGTTNKPKGVVITHQNLEAQITSLINAWEWKSTDHTLCVLPLHHVHGIVNVICCAMWAGATCEFIDGFSADEIFALFEKGELNLFMAVPTIYFKLIAYWETITEAEQNKFTDSMKNFRLMVCGSAALPVTIMEKWKQISGHILLERYGMTEMGMAISNPYVGERRPGYVGIPLPGVKVQLVNEKFETVQPGVPGEILVKGENVFHQYWNNPVATKESFTMDGWFKTGDVAIEDDGYYRIMGRNSVDIIKSGGYKISALEIEEVLRTHNEISDCAVVGIPDEEWGELIVAALVTRETNFDTATLHEWLRERIASYKTPRKYLLLKELPRNAMGKVTKNDVKKLF